MWNGCYKYQGKLECVEILYFLVDSSESLKSPHNRSFLNGLKKQFFCFCFCFFNMLFSHLFMGLRDTLNFDSDISFPDKKFKFSTGKKCFRVGEKGSPIYGSVL